MTAMRIERDDPARFYEALGRVMAALRESGGLRGVSLDWWNADGGWQIEWQQGPFPAEVAQALLAAAGVVDEEDFRGGPLRAAAVVEPGRPSPYPDSNAHLRVLGVPVTLRAAEPVGAAETQRRLTRHLRELAGQQPR
jgi:hypothetical protein